MTARHALLDQPAQTPVAPCIAASENPGQGSDGAARGGIFLDPVGGSEHARAEVDSRPLGVARIEIHVGRLEVRQRALAQRVGQPQILHAIGVGNDPGRRVVQVAGR